jgi:hypothetical protein
LERVDISFARRTQNYLYTETATVLNAWVGVPSAQDTWLYWDLNTKTGLRTFGFTLVLPRFGTVRPTSPVADLHWYDTFNKQMFVYTNGKWIEKIRVFAAKVNSSTFTPMGDGLSSKPFAGTQVGLTGTAVETSYITYDELGKPIIRDNGDFFTLSSPLFARGSAVNQVKLDANVIFATAAETIPQFSVVRLSQFDKILLCDYANVRTSIVGLSLDSLAPDELGRIVAQGVVTNPLWNWSAPGRLLWASDTGVLSETDPHATNNILFPESNPPVAKVISPISILFDQSLGEKGETGAPGADGQDGQDGVSAGSDPATVGALGVVKISVNPTDSLNPIAVGTNDPRMTNARAPTAHTHPISDVINLQTSLNSKLSTTGGTLTGPLVLPAESGSVNPLQAPTVQYVQSRLTINSIQQYDLNFYISGYVDIPNEIVGSYLCNRGQTILSNTTAVPLEFGTGTGTAEHLAYSFDPATGAVLDLIKCHAGTYTDIGTLTLNAESNTHTIDIPVSVSLVPGDLILVRTRSIVDVNVKDITISIMSSILIKYTPTL